jgi:hypothetical protein
MNKSQNKSEEVKLDYNALKAEAKALGLDTKGKASELDTRIDEYHKANAATADAEVKVKKRGRKINPDSPRQKRLALQAAGTGQRGRPADPNSAWNKKQAALEAKRTEGTLKLGRAIDPNSARQARLAMVGKVKRGRPAGTKSTPIEDVVDASAEAVIENMVGKTE